ncbi:MAG: universal stress protein, partial [Rhodospirillaceae bacterium]|nr:universal stress protein [Rhodospirillaceae bacterium]
MTKLIALIDGSIYSESVCDHAAWAAARCDASVELIHVLGRRDTSSAPVNLSGNLDANARDTLLEELASLDESKAKLAMRRGRLILDEAHARLVTDGIEAVETKLRHGEIVETLQEFEAEADLIVIGKRGEAADFDKLHLGSNLERVVRSSHKPVLVAARAFRAVNRFLIAFDGGSSAKMAVEHVARSKLFAGLPCRLLTVGNDTPEARSKLDEAAALLGSGGRDVTADIVPGHADAAIAEAVTSDAIDMVVMG